MKKSIVVLSATVVAVFSMGCGDPDRLPTYKTTGTVTYTDGKPIDEGTIMFHSDGLPPARAIIDGGDFTMGTYEESDGAVAAKFAAAIMVNPPADFDPDAGKRSVGAKAKYEDPKTSGLEFEVTEDGDNHFEIKLERGK